MVYRFTGGTGETVHISIRPESTAVGAGSSFSFDREGRLLTAHFGEGFYKRGLDDTLLRTNRAPGGEKRFVTVSAAERSAVVRRTQESIGFVLANLPDDAPPEVSERLRLAAARDESFYASERRSFERLYKPVGILPPDQYRSLVLQATEGCHYNQCTFCRFYEDVPFRIKPPDEFRAHIDDVIRFIGRGIALRSSLFLADANALVHTRRKLIPLFQVVNDRFQIPKYPLSGEALRRWKHTRPFGMAGIYSFIDAFTGKKKSQEELAELAELGLRRMYIGMESGHEPLLKFMEKPSMPGDVLELVGTARAAGVQVAVIVMAGIGGRRYAEGHFRDSVDTINRLGLSGGDLVYISEFVDTPGSEYSRRATESGIEPLTVEETVEQARRLRNALRLEPGVGVARYDVREFVY